MEHILYWLWLTTKYGVTPSKIKVLLEYFKTVEEIYFSKNKTDDMYNIGYLSYHSYFFKMKSEK